jgi:mitochondrial fission protein ELM1
MRAERGSVLVTTSRRTPDAWRQVVQRALADIPGVRWFAPASGDAGEDNPYPGMLAWADRIVCTPDSVNMISEACATRVPVLVPGMEGSDGRLRRFHESLRASGRVHGLGEEAWSTAAVAPLRETVRVARVVRDRLGLDAGEWAQGAHAAVQAGTP